MLQESTTLPIQIHLLLGYCNIFEIRSFFIAASAVSFIWNNWESSNFLFASPTPSIPSSQGPAEPVYVDPPRFSKYIPALPNGLTHTIYFTDDGLAQDHRYHIFIPASSFQYRALIVHRILPVPPRMGPENPCSRTFTISSPTKVPQHGGPNTITTTVITLVTVIEDLIEVGQNIKRSIEKVKGNRRQIREFTEEILRMLSNPAIHCDSRETMFQTRELLYALGEFKA
ncbi:hypothetical protein C8J57DRAFT_1523912 [Mycena rebaudengoi]|nr:hypothetical protein C8J57DRAFT_1523912 [Mycena rebaudengoi]